jgi:predicted nucleic acid-binding protein
VSPRRVYVESSALLRALLDGDRAARAAIDAAEVLCASELTFLEAARAIIRAKHTSRLDAKQAREVAREIAAIERECDLVGVGEEVLRSARQEFPVEPVRTLDAIHLATIKLLDEELGDVVVASCDDRVRENVEAMSVPLAPAARR